MRNSGNRSENEIGLIDDAMQCFLLRRVSGSAILHVSSLRALAVIDARISSTQF